MFPLGLCCPVHAVKPRLAAAMAVWFVVSGPGVSAADEAALFETARVHLQKGHYAEALEVYDELARGKPDTVQLAVGRSRALEAQGRLSAAVGTLQETVESEEKNAPLWARLAELQFQQGRYSDAEDSVGRALQLDPEQPLAHLVQADLFTETGRISKADEAYRWFVRYYNRTQPKDADTLLLVARGALRYARWHSVPQIFDFVVNTLCPDALQADKLCWQAHDISGSLLLEKFNRADALPELHQALAINPRAAVVLVALGNASLENQAWEEAEDFADRALHIQPDFVSALWLKADVRIFAGRLKEAERLLQRTLSVNPNEQRTLGRLAACYLLQEGIPPDEQFGKLLTLFNADDQIGNASGTLPKSRFAKLVLDLAQRNSHPGYFLAVLGEALDAHRKYSAAEQVYRQALVTMPQLAGPKTALGMLYMRIGKTKQAETILDEAFRADPYHVRVSNMRKVVKLLDGYEAITTDHFVIRVDPDHDRILGRYVAEYLEEVYPELVQQFGYEPPQRTQFEIYYDGKGVSAHQWFSARMVGLPWLHTVGASTGLVVALASPTAVDEPFNWARVVKHELVHIFTLQQTDFNIPHWFTEALAVINEGYPRPELWDRLLRERVLRGELRTLDTLNDGFLRPESSGDWNFAYCQSRLYVEYMVETFGPQTISYMLDAYRRNLPTASAIEQVCGVKKETFERGYREYLDRLVAELPAGRSTEQRSPAEIEKAYRADPDNANAIADYAQLLMKGGQPDQARELAEKALDLNPKQPAAALVIAQLELRAQNTDEAVGYLETALDRSRPHRDVLVLLADLKRQQGELSAAAELYELGRKSFPSDGELLKGAAATFSKLGETSKLKQVLRLLAELDPDDAAVRKTLARLALEDESYAEAVKYGRMALQVDVLDVDVHRMLGRSYLRLDQPKRAVREFAVALQLKPQDDDLELALARAYLAAGNKAEARSRLERLLKRHPDHADAKKLLTELD